MFTVFKEASECVGFEPMLERPPRIRMDDKEHSAIVAGESENPKMKIYGPTISWPPSICLEGIWRGCSPVNKHLKPSLWISQLIVINQSIIFLTTPPTEASLRPFDGFRSWPEGRIFFQPDVVHAQCLEQNMIRIQICNRLP